jgi:hypothetical protein
MREMYKQLKTIGRQAVNALLGAVNLELLSLNHRYSDYKNYIPCQSIITEAKSAGLSVGDYIDAKHNKPGSTQETIDRMATLGVFQGKIDRLCEIEPSSGRYLEKTLKACSPSTGWRKFIHH